MDRKKMNNIQKTYGKEVSIEDGFGYGDGLGYGSGDGSVDGYGDGYGA